MNKNYYVILGVSEKATQSEIKKQYRKLASIHHPDRPGGNDDIFAEINIAFTCLSDENKRLHYDYNLFKIKEAEETKRKEFENEIKAENEHRENIKKQQNNNSSNNEYYNFNHSTGFSGNYPDFTRNYSDHIVKTKSIYLFLPLTIKDSLKGTCKNIKFERIISCSYCRGYGYGFLPNNAKVECPNCMGTGQKLQDVMVKLTIPPNTITGMKLKLPNRGNESNEAGIANGDVIVNIQWGDNWTSKNKNIYTEKKLNNSELKNGFFNFKNFDGEKLKVYIPEGINEGQYIKIEKKGWKPFNSHLYIKILFKKNIFRRLIDFLF